MGSQGTGDEYIFISGIAQLGLWSYTYKGVVSFPRVRGAW